MNSNRLILALDLESLSEAEKKVELLKGRISIFKIGLQLFTGNGPEAVEMVRHKGGKVFLDLKYHDIPNTVAGAAKEATRLGVSMFTIHTFGGEEMMKRCRDAVIEASIKGNITRPMIIGITLLTSLDQKALATLGINSTIKDAVRRLSERALRAGLDGVVASPEEVKSIRGCCGKDFIIITPGVRPEGAPLDDQKRVMTPKDAIREGADYLVMGRPILMADDPLTAAERILKDIS